MLRDVRTYLGTNDSVRQNLRELDEWQAGEAPVLAADHVYDMDHALLVPAHRVLQ